MKLVTELKPDTLSHDASAGELRIWCRILSHLQHAASTQPSSAGLPVELFGFRAIFASDEHNCSYNAGVGSRRVVPYYASEHISSEISLAAKTEAWNCSPARTSALSQSIKTGAGETDIQGMTMEDSLCLVCLTGLKDNRLREKLSELETPTLPAFAVLIDAYMHSKATASSSAAAAATDGRQQNKGGNKNNNNGNRPGLRENEKKRRSVMKGKCYRFGSPDHMANNCSVAKGIKCKKCNGVGHTQAACIASG